MKTFKELCQEAYDLAWANADGWVPSEAQYAVALQPMIDEFKAHDWRQAVEFITDTFDVYGLMPMAVRMYKEQTEGQRNAVAY